MIFNSYYCKNYSVHLYESNRDLNGLTGDDDETFCVFVRVYKNPLTSGWKWFHDENKARLFGNKYREEK
jgi:hypothetical protein